jgi:Sporulation and spore germination
MPILHGTQAQRLMRNALLMVALLLLGSVGIAFVELSPAPGADAAFRSQRPLTSAQWYQSSVSARKTTSVRIYLIAIGGGGRTDRRIGCGDSLVAVARSIAPTTTPLSAAMRLLLSDHHRYYGQSGLYNALYQSRLRLQRAAVVKGKATIYLVGTMRLGGVCDDPRAGAQLRQTARQFPTVHSVAIFINNTPLWKRLSEKGR